MNTFCLYNNQLQLLFSPDHVILLLGNLPGDKVLHLVHLPVLVQLPTKQPTKQHQSLPKQPSKIPKIGTQ